MKSTQQITKSALKMASYDMKRFHDQKVQPPVKYKPGDLVLLEATNIQTEQPSKKLDNKRYGPFKVIKKEGLGHIISSWTNCGVKSTPSSTNAYSTHITRVISHLKNNHHHLPLRSYLVWKKQK